jgi:hypothetical protein
MVAPDKLEDSVLTRVLSGHERGPGYGGNRWKSGCEIGSRAAGYQARNARKVALLNQRIENIE